MNLRKYRPALLAAATAIAVFSFSGCKSREKIDLTGIHTTEAETMSPTAAKKETESQTKAETKKQETETKKGTDSASALSVRSEIATEKRDNISIEYPILSNLRDSSKTEAVNALLKEQALRIIGDYELNPKTDTVSIDCSILSLDRSRIVLTFEGSMMSEGVAHPTELFYTITADLDQGTLLGFSDYADAKAMAEYIVSDQCVLYKPADSEEVLSELQSMDVTLLTELLEHCDFSSVKPGTFPSSFSYENQGDIFMVLPVSHAAGDYAIVRFSPDTK